MKCPDHLNFRGQKCEDCGLDVDQYGNTEDQFDNCSFPDCGCDGSRLCMAANGASDDSCSYNVEGMYRLRDPRPRMKFLGFVIDKEKEAATQPTQPKGE